MKLKHILPYVIIAGLVVYLLTMEKGVEYITLPPKVNTKVITTPHPIVTGERVLNIELKTQYEKAKTQAVKDSIFEKAITQRTYVEELKDSVQTITVTSKVTGTLDEQIISYKTNPVTIERKTLKSRTSLYVGGFTSIPSRPEQTFNAGALLNLKTKNKIYSIGYDTDRRITAGVTFKLF